MSQANMGVVRSIYAHWERGDFLSAPWAHPEIEYVMADGPSPGKWHGLAGMSSAGRANLDAWRELRFEAAEYHELDGERVLVIHRPSGKGKASGLEIGHTHSKCASLFQLRAGRVTRLVHYWDGDRALSDLGPAPEAGAR